MLNLDVCKGSLLASLLLSTAVTGCSGDGQSAVREEGETPAPTSDSDDARRSASEDAEDRAGEEDDGSSDASEKVATTAGFVTNTPDANFKVTGNGGMKLRLASSNLVGRAMAGERAYHQWFAEVRNDGAAPACLVSVDVLAKDASGTAVSKVSAYLVAEPYAVGSTDGQSAACISPEGHGILWGNYLGPLALEASAVATIELSYSGVEVEDAVPHDAAPFLSSATLGTRLERHTVSATATAKSTLSQLGIEVFGLRADGLIVDRATARHLEPLAAGLSWAYEERFRNDAEGVERVVQHPSFTPAGEPTLALGLSTKVAPLASTTFSRVARAVQARASEVEGRR